MRLDVPHLRSLASGVAFDFDAQAMSAKTVFHTTPGGVRTAVLAKPVRRRTINARQDRHASRIVKSVRAQCVERDGYWRGKAAPTAGTVPLLLYSGWADKYATSVLRIAADALIGLVLFVAFVLVERRAAEPVLPLWVFRHRVVGAAMAERYALALGRPLRLPCWRPWLLTRWAVAHGPCLQRHCSGTH